MIIVFYEVVNFKDVRLAVSFLQCHTIYDRHLEHKYEGVDPLPP